jgi:anaerobic selenocysteine-containing dehydrogenase
LIVTETGKPNTQVRRSFCRLCGSYCAVLATVDGERIVKIAGDREDPVSRGYLCSKGRALARFHHHPRRLDRPRIRSNGMLEEVGWDPALADLSTKLRAVIARHGPAAVGGYAGTPAVPCTTLNVWRSFLAALGTSQIYSTISVDVPCVPLVAERICGNPMVTSQPDVDASMTVLIGVNPMVSHGHVFFMPAPKTQLRRWATQGELWVIDPRRSETAAVATRHLAPWPGTEFMLLGYAVHALLDAGADRAFLNAYASGVEVLRAAVQRFTLAAAVAATRLREEDVMEFVAAIRSAGRVAIHCGTGISMGVNANVTTFLMWVLHAVTGSLDRRGGAYFNPGFIRNLDSVGWQAVNATGPGPRSRPDLPSRLGEYPCAALADEIEAGNLKALFVFAGNPVIALPQTQRLISALSKLEVLVVIDVVETACTRLATHVLPGAGQLEMADLITFDFINPVEYTRYSPRIVEPASERKPLWWILRELAQRTGIESGLPEGIDDDDDILRMMMATARASFDEVRSCPTAVVSKGRTYEWVHRHLPGGRWNLAPQDLIEQLGRAEASRDQWVLVPHRQRYKLNSQMSDGLARPRRPDRAALSIHPDDAAGLGVADGNMVVIESAAGTITAPAHLDASYRRGVVSLPHGFADVNVNVLTDASKTDPLSGMVILSAFPVSLRRDERHGAGVRAPR